jgi:hypothetical protein
MNQAIQKGSAYGKGLNQNVFIKAILSLESIEGGVNLGEGISLFGSLQSSNPQDGGKLVMVSHFMIVGTSLAVSFMDAWAKSMGNPNLKTSEDDMAKIQAIFGRIKTKPMDNGVQLSFTMTKDETDITVKKMKESIQKAKEERKKRLEKEKIGKLNDAIRKGDMEKVRSILAAGVEINGADPLGQVPLLVACEANSAESVKLLLEKGAEAAVAAKDGSTPLHICAASGNVEILKLLAQKNPNINARTRKGLTPLHIAAGKGHLPMVKALVERRADLMAEDDGEEKPADKARVNGHAEVAEYLDKLMKKPQGEDKGQE